MALQANALTTLARFKDYIGCPLSDTSKDARYEFFIDATSAVMETYCERNFARSDYVERHDGRLSDTLVLKNWPIVSVSQIRVSQAWDFSDPQSVLEPEYYVVENESVIRLRSRLFSKGSMNVQVSYTAGWITPQNPNSNLPKDLELTCLQLTEFYLQTRDDRRTGVTSKSKNTESISYLGDLPDFAKMILDDYSRSEFAAGLVSSVTNG